jgi:hypothetical protein
VSLTANCAFGENDIKRYDEYNVVYLFFNYTLTMACCVNAFNARQLVEGQKQLAFLDLGRA